MTVLLFEIAQHFDSARIHGKLTSLSNERECLDWACCAFEPARSGCMSDSSSPMFHRRQFWKCRDANHSVRVGVGTKSGVVAVFVFSLFKQYVLDEN